MELDTDPEFDIYKSTIINKIESRFQISEKSILAAILDRIQHFREIDNILIKMASTKFDLIKKYCIFYNIKYAESNDLVCVLYVSVI